MKNRISTKNALSGIYILNFSKFFYSSHLFPLKKFPSFASWSRWHVRAILTPAEISLQHTWFRVHAHRRDRGQGECFSSTASSVVFTSSRPQELHLRRIAINFLAGEILRDAAESPLFSRSKGNVKLDEGSGSARNRSLFLRRDFPALARVHLWVLGGGWGSEDGRCHVVADCRCPGFYEGYTWEVNGPKVNRRNRNFVDRLIFCRSFRSCKYPEILKFSRTEERKTYAICDSLNL